MTRECPEMAKAVNTSTGARYVYRADGMRTQKVEGFNLSWTWTDLLHTSGYYDVVTATNLPTTRYFYDGQMGMEDDYTHHVGSADQVDVTRYGLGARGIDRIEKTTDAYGSSPVTNVSYPIYDGHGNMVRTLSRSGSGYAVTAERVFGAWGELRTSTGPTDSKGRYCANLGHVQDDESGLIYMRARYYEPGTGRFVSQDRALNGSNWLTYCANDPVNNLDESGRSFTDAAKWLQDLLRGWGELGRLIYNTIVAGGVATVGVLVTLMVKAGRSLIKSGLKLWGYGAAMLASAEGMDEAGGPAALLASRYMIRGVSEIVLGGLLLIASFLLPILYGDEVEG